MQSSLDEEKRLLGLYFADIATSKPLSRQRETDLANRIEQGRIRVRFDDVANFDGEGPTTLMLHADTALTELVLTWARDDGGQWQFQGVTRSD